MASSPLTSLQLSFPSLRCKTEGHDHYGKDEGCYQTVFTMPLVEAPAELTG